MLPFLTLQASFGRKTKRLTFGYIHGSPVALQRATLRRVPAPVPGSHPGRAMALVLQTPDIAPKLLQWGETDKIWLEPLRLACLDYPDERRRILRELPDGDCDCERERSRRIRQALGD